MNKGKKISGGRYIQNRKKKKYEIAGQKNAVKMGEERRKKKKMRGGKEKVFLIRAKYVNVISKNKKKTEKIEIKNVLETPSNRFLARQNIITKGTVIETNFGKVKVTNRPSQDGVVNGIFIE
jgi:small subunit ribosomal protein S8e